jgi:hypothetical protein
MVSSPEVVEPHEMDIASIFKSLESMSFATAIRDSLYIFPLLEGFHVVGLSLVFGCIAIIDFRLLGWASTNRSFKQVFADIMTWIWVAYGLTIATGLLMFSTNAVNYYGNTVFRVKMVMLVIAGINMGIFEMTAGRTVRRGDTSSRIPGLAKTTAALSLAFWISIVFLGRWIGFTVTQAPVEAPAEEVNFDDIFGGAPAESTPPSPPENK